MKFMIPLLMAVLPAPVLRAITPGAKACPAGPYLKPPQ